MSGRRASGNFGQLSHFSHEFRLRFQHAGHFRPSAETIAQSPKIGGFHMICPLRLNICISLLALPATLAAEETYFEALVELESPKKAHKRSEEGGPKHAPFRVWIPQSKAPVRGFVFNPFYTKAVTQKHWQAACRQWDFGILAANFFGVKNREFKPLTERALEQFAKRSGRSEINDAMLCPVGMSAGAGMSTRIAEAMPERVIAVGPVCLEVAPRGPESMGIPTMTIFGERDGSQYEKLMARLPETRIQGGLYSIAVQWRRRHEFARANNLLVLLFDAAIKHRLPELPDTALKPMEESAGWLGDVQNWRNGEATITPYSSFQGDKNKACWFPDAKTAHAWQAFVTFEPKLELTAPPGLGDGQPFVLHKVDELIEVRVKSSQETKEPIMVYSGHHRLGALKNGVLKVRFSQPGFYPLHLESVTSDGTQLRSRPNTLIVE